MKRFGQDLINVPVVQDVVADPELDRNQKTAKLRFYLKQRRYPAICKAEKEFEKEIKCLKLGSGISLLPPPHFEGHIIPLNCRLKIFLKLEGTRKHLIEL